VSDMLLDVVQVLYFFAPAYAANMAPVLIGERLKRLAVPLDLGASVSGVRILGDHKTLRGLVVGMLAGAGVFLLQRAAHRAAPMQSLALTDYAALPSLAGAWLGFGAIAGDAVKSFFKRRVGIAPGRPWIGPDELDFYVGAIAAAACLVPLPLVPVLLSIPLVFCGHVLSNVIAYGLGLKDTWI
jgi:CDP-2,3-bis-(O-geranylgeranyl)-sn-glycerol synthase